MQKTVIDHEQLFVGEDLALDYHDGGHAISIVTFEARNKYISAVKASPFEAGYGRGIFAKQGFNEFLVKRSRNHWYQTDEIVKVIELIKARSQGHTLITYGGSMGGMAAISFAEKLGAASFIALSPLYDIEEGGEVLDDRWGDEGRTLDFKHNYIRTGECKEAQGYVFYCPDTVDVEHAQHIERMTSGTLVPLEYGGHPVSFFLNDTYKLKRLVAEIARGEFDLQRFKEEVNTNTALTHYPHEKQAAEFIRSDNLLEAISSMRTAAEMNPKIARLPFRLAELLLQSGNLDEAEKACLQALDIDPSLLRAHIRLSHIYEKQNRVSDAIRSVRKAIKGAPRKTDFHLRLGNLLLKASRAKEAEACFAKAHEIAPNRSTAHVRRSHALAAQGRWAEAIQAMENAISMEPEKSEYYLRLGEWQLKSKDFHNAELSMNIAITMAPENSHYRVRLSYLFAAQKNYERAASAMDRAIQFKPEDSAYHLRLGECLIKTGDLFAARKSLTEAARLAPKSERIKDRLNYLESEINQYQEADLVSAE